MRQVISELMLYLFFALAFGFTCASASSEQPDICTFTVPGESLNVDAQFEGSHWWASVGGDIRFLEWLEAKSIVKQAGRSQDDQFNEVFMYEMDIKKAYEHKKEICARFKMVGDDIATNILYGLMKAAIAFDDREIVRFFINLPGPDGAGQQNKQDILREIKDTIPVTFFQVFLEQSKRVQESIIPLLFDLSLVSYSAVETVSLLTADGEVYKLSLTAEDIQLQLLLRLAPEIMERKPTLHGVFDFDGDGEGEVFIEWHEQRPEYGIDHHYQIYKKKEKYEILGDFKIEDMMEDCDVVFVTEPDPDQPRKVLLTIRGGSRYCELYLLSRDGKSANEVYGAASWGLQDIDRDGIYELVMIQIHSGEERFSIDLQFRYIGIFQWDDDSLSYRKIWSEDGEVIAELYDVDDDGCDEIVALTDTGEEKEGRKLSIYKLSNKAFLLISQLDVTYPYTAFDIHGIRRLKDRKQIVLLLEEFKSREEIQKDPHAQGAQVMRGFDFKDGHLEPAWLNDKIEVADYSASIEDTDGDGEKMVFMDRETGKPVMLKGERAFFNLYSMESYELTPQGIAQPIPPEEISYNQLVKWKRNLKGYLPYPPLLCCGTIYEASFNAEGTIYQLHALIPETGEIKWKFQQEGNAGWPSTERGLPYVSSIAVEDGIVIASSQRSHFVALDAQTGELRWEYDTGSYESVLRHGMQRNPAWLIPKIKNGLVYIKSEDGMLTALNLKTGELCWQFDTGVSGFIPPLITEEKIYTQSQNGIAALNTHTGELIWETPMPLGWDWVNFTLDEVDQVSGLQVRYYEDITTGLYEGLQGSDLILEVDGTPVQNLEQFVAAIHKTQPGQPALKIIRAGEEQTLQITVPEEPPIAADWLSLAICGDMLCAGNMCDSALYGLNAETGEVLWRVRDKVMRNVDKIRPHVSGIYVFSGYRHLYRGYIKDEVSFVGDIAVFSNNGELRWRATDAGLPLLTYGGKLYMMSNGQTAVGGEFVSEERDTLTALSDTDGHVLWQIPLAGMDPVYATDATVCCASPWGLNLRAFDSTTGEPLWSLPTTAYHFIGNNGLLVFVCSEDQLLAISLAEATRQLAQEREARNQWEQFAKSLNAYACLVPYEEAPSSVKKHLWEKMGINWWGPDESILIGENAIFFGPYPFDPRTNTRLWKDPGFDAISSEGHFEQIKAVARQGVYYFTRWYMGSSSITCRSLDAGETIWQREIPGEEQEIGEAFWTDTFVIANGQVYAELVAATEVPHNGEGSLYRVESIHLYALDALTGETLWVFSVDPPAAPQWEPWYRPNVPIVVTDDLVYWGVEGCLYALDPKMGDVRWQYTDPDALTKPFSNNSFVDQPETSLAVSEGVVCIVTAEKLYMLDANTGDLKWQLPVEGLFPRLQTSIYKGRVYAVAYDIKPPICSTEPSSYDQQNNVSNLYLYSLRADTGEVDWMMTFPVQNQYITEYAFDSDMIYLQANAALYVLSAETGQLQWQFSHGARLCLGKENVYVMGDRLYALDKVTGNVKWSNGYRGSIYGSVESDGFLYLKVDAPGEFNPCRLIYVLDLIQVEKLLASGTRWWTEPAERKDIPTLKKISKRPISGFILDNYWLGIGPFDNTDNKGLTFPYPPEREFDASATYQGKTGEVRWQRARDNRQIDGLLSFSDIFFDEWVEGPDKWVLRSDKWNEELNEWVWEPDELVLAYALIDVVSPDDRNVQLRIGSGDGVKVWLNGEVVWTNQIPRQIKLDEDVVPVELKKGSNRLLFKVGFSKDTSCCHFWGLIVRITDENGHPIESLQYAIPR